MVYTNESLIKYLSIALFIAIVIFIAKAILATIKWLFRSLRFLFTGKSERKDPLKSKDWLTRAQARQEIRFQNAMPPLLSKATPQKKSFISRMREKKGKSPTGWTFNEETQLWEPPKKLRK